MNRASMNENSAREILGILFRHKRKSLGFMAGVVTVVSLFTFLSPTFFRSEAKLLVRLGRESVSLDPTATTGKVVAPIRQSRESELNSELELLRSRDLAEAVVDAISPAVILAKSDKPAASKTLEPDEDALVARQRAIRIYIESARAELVKGSNVITISYEARTPKLSMEVLAQIIEAHNEKHVLVYRTSGSLDFFTKQAEKERAKLEATDEELRRLATISGVTLSDDFRSNFLNQMGRQQEQIDATHAALAASRAKIKSLEQLMPGLPREVTKETTSMPSRAAEAIRETLQDLRMEEQAMLNRYKNEEQAGPRLVRVRQQIAEAENRLETEGQDRPQVTTSLNQTHQQVEGDLIAERATVASLQAKLGTLRADATEAAAKLKGYNEAETKMAPLLREREIQETNYLAYAQKVEVARIDNALETEMFSNIRVLQPPTHPIRPIRPRKALNMVLGLIIGALGALGLAFAADFMDHTIKKPRDISERLELPVLVDIPLLWPRAKSNGNGGGRPLVHAPMPAAANEEILRYCEVLRDRMLLYHGKTMRQPCTIAVTSCHRGEGVSTVASNLAATLSCSSNGRVLLLDGNVVRQFEEGRGLKLQTRLLSSEGRQVSDTTTYEAQPLDNLVPLLKRDYSFVVFDVPATMDMASSALQVANLADGVIMVVEAERTGWHVVKEARDLLRQANAEILGVVLNKRKFYVPDWLYRRV